jgi:hypothetical protein
MTNRIIKDIRFYELKPKDFNGNFDGIVGKVFQNSKDTNNIGQRIARKLNELEFISGEFDHIYINFSPNMSADEIIVSEKFIDKQIKYIDYGIEPKIFNSLTDFEKDLKVKEITFKALFLLYINDKQKTERISEVENLINKFETEIEIAYKTKETNSYRIEIGYMIKPKNSLSKIVVKYFDKKNNTKSIGTKDLNFYEDIFYLVDKISMKDEVIIFTSKKSTLGEIATEKYEKPVKIDTKQLRQI